MQFYCSSQCQTSSYKHFMGNCTGSQREDEQLTMLPSKLSNSLRIEEGRIRSKDTSRENVDISLRGNLPTRTVPCKIPILKDGFTPPTFNNGSYKSVMLDQCLSSRIPVNKSVECQKSVSMVFRDDDTSQRQLFDSGFVSDLSVSVSLYSQVNNDARTAENVNVDVVDVAMARHRKLTKIPVKDDFKEIVQKVSKDSELSSKNIPLEVITTAPATTPVSSFDIGRKLKRPQSLSTESELILNKSRPRSSTTGSVMVAPLSVVDDKSSVMQDVSSLKLMLHKLKRYLLQDEDEGSTDLMTDSVFRVSHSQTFDIKTMPREDLEAQCGRLLEKNETLEKLLESREKIITQLQSDKRLFTRIAQPALGHDKENDTKGQGLRNVPYHWSNLKLPQEHI